MNGGIASGGIAVAFPQTLITISNSKVTDNLAMGGQAGVGGTGGIGWGGAGTGTGGGVYNDIDNGATISIDDLDLIFANMADEFPDCFGCLL